MTFDLVVLGECNLDVIAGSNAIPRWGQAEQLVERVDIVLGGSGAITAVGAAKLGLSVALVAVVGDDDAGRRVVAETAAAGVDTRGVRALPGAVTGTSVILVDGDDRAILTAQGTIASLSAAEVPEALLSAARWVHVSSYFLQEALQPGLARLLESCRRAGTGVSIDPNWDPSERFDGLAEILGAGDLLFVNEREACRLASIEDPIEAARALAARGTDVVVKRGAAGASLVTAAGAWHAPAPVVETVDAVGAGDSFAAAFLACWLRDLGRTEALAAACTAGARSVASAGGTGGQLCWEELFASDHPSDHPSDQPSGRHSDQPTSEMRA